MTSRVLEFQIGVVRAKLHTKLGRLRQQYRDLYSAHEMSVNSANDSAIHIDVRRTPASLNSRRRFDVRTNGTTRFSPSHFDSVLPHVEWAVSWELPRALPQYLQLHASALEVGGAGVIFPGNAGVGKSTLAVGLLSRGWRYLCDEFALLHAETLELHPYPRALCIKEPAFGVLRELGLEVPRERCFSKGSKGAVTLIPPRSIRPDACGTASPLRFVIFPNYVAGTKPSLTPISRSEAVFAMHGVCFNLLSCRRLGLDILTEAIRGAECFRLTAGDIHETCILIEQTVGSALAKREGTRAQRRQGPRIEVRSQVRAPEFAVGSTPEPRATRTLCTDERSTVVEAPAQDPFLKPSYLVGVNNVHMLHELDKLVAVLNRSGIDVMLLKGAALNKSFYDRIDLRPMGDLDLLVRPFQATKAVSVLREHGCRPGMALVRDDFFPRFHYELELLTPPPHSVRIDLHARPLRPLRISQTLPDDALWSGAEPVSCGAAPAFVPRPEMMLLHLAAHAAYHGCRRKLWLFDIHSFCRRYGSFLDWLEILERGQAWRLNLPILLALRRAEEAFGPFCSPEVRRRLEAGPISWRDRLTLSHAPHDAASPWSHLTVNLLCTPGVAFKLRYIWAYLLPSREHLAGLYPFRHLGWPVAAAGWRMLRGYLRLAALPANAVRGAFRWMRTHWRARRRWGRVSIGPSPIHGMGVFALRGIPSGAVIGRYRGRRVSSSGSHTATRIKPDGRRHYYELALPYKLLNHSPYPNAVISRHSRVVKALLPIAPGSEITIDYGAHGSVCSNCGREHMLSQASALGDTDANSRGIRLDALPKPEARRSRSVAIVMTVKNDTDGCLQTLQSLVAQTRSPDEIIVVDGGSTDGTVDAVRRIALQHSMIRVLEAPGANIARGRNIGTQTAISDIIATTDSGCVAESNWLEKLADPFEFDPKLEFVGGFYRIAPESLLESVVGLSTMRGQIREEGTPARSHVATEGNAATRIHGCTETIIHANTDSRTDPQYSARATSPASTAIDSSNIPSFHLPSAARSINAVTFNASGRSMAYSKECWRRVGGWPEWLSYSEDTLFSTNLRRQGVTRRFAADAIVHWRPRTCLRAIARQFYLYGTGRGHTQIGAADFRYNLRAFAVLGGTAALCLKEFWFAPLFVLVFGYFFVVRFHFQALRIARHTGHPAAYPLSLLVSWIVTTANTAGYLVGTMQRWNDRERFERRSFAYEALKC